MPYNPHPTTTQKIDKKSILSPKSQVEFWSGGGAKVVWQDHTTPTTPKFDKQIF